MAKPSIYREYARGGERMIVRAVYLPGWSGVDGGPFGALVGVAGPVNRTAWRTEWIHAYSVYGLRDKLQIDGWEPVEGSEPINRDAGWLDQLRGLADDFLRKVELADTKDGVR